MYSSKRNNYSFGRQGSGFHNHIKKPYLSAGPRLDPRLFVREATETGIQKEKTNALFSQYNIASQLKRNIAERGYISPTEIQEKAIPYIMESKDVIGVANTGTGKTAAFLIPLINKSFHDRNQRVLIVVPTRELAVQIADEFRIFAKGMHIESVLSIGGVSIRRQMYVLRHNPHFVIGTPGRLKDLIERKLLNLMLFQNIVLDEVDRMVDIGFIKDIQYLISFLPKIRQSLFFSATVDGKTKEILQSFVTNPITVSVKQNDTVESIDQDIIKITDRNSKLDILHRLLMKEEFHKVLIFGRTKWGMEKLTRALTQRGVRAAAIHGNKSQTQRQRALKEFKENQIQVLIATDVASRGIDIENVTHVINYDLPASYTDYIHRIGRTGRAGKRGTALTFVE